MYEELQQAVIEGNDQKSEELTRKYMDDGAESSIMIKEGLLKGMNEVGIRFKAYEMYLPEVIMSANAMKRSMALLKPLISEADTTSMGKILILTIQGDLHDIGKNLVSMMLEGAGFEIIDLGVDVPISKIATEVEKNNIDLVAISALLTTTMLAMEPAIKKIKDFNKDMPVMVGGAPLTKEFADKVGANGFAPDALRAIELAKRLLNIN